MTRATSGRLPWAAVEWAYVSTNVPVKRIAGLFAIPLAALRNEITRRGWTRCRGPAALQPIETCNGLAARLSSVASRQVTFLEREMKEPRLGKEINARRIAAVVALARLIEHMAKLESGQSDRQADADMPRAIDDARRLELARRLEGLSRQIEDDRR